MILNYRKEYQVKRKRSVSNGRVNLNKVSAQMVPEVIDDASVWTKAQVKNWLEKKVGNQKLVKMMGELDGTLLRQICVMRKEAPEYFYAEFKNTFKLDFFEMLKFTSELDKEFKNFSS